MIGEAHSLYRKRSTDTGIDEAAAPVLMLLCEAVSNEEDRGAACERLVELVSTPEPPLSGGEAGSLLSSLSQNLQSCNSEVLLESRRHVASRRADTVQRMKGERILPGIGKVFEVDTVDDGESWCVEITVFSGKARKEYVADFFSRLLPGSLLPSSPFMRACMHACVSERPFERDLHAVTAE